MQGALGAQGLGGAPKPKQSTAAVRRGLGAWHSFTVEKVFLVEPNTDFNRQQIYLDCIEEHVGAAADNL